MIPILGSAGLTLVPIGFDSVLVFVGFFVVFCHTFTLHLYFFFPILAVITAVPCFLAVTFPFLVTGGTVYFKLTETLKGQEAENRLLQMNQSLEEIKQGEYEHTGTTLVLFVYDVQAVNGFAAYPLNGLDIINSYTLYDGTCSKNIKNIESFYLSEGYEAMIPTNLNLYTGASSKMYEALWVPDEMTSFSNQLYTRKLTPYWVRYQF